MAFIRLVTVFLCITATLAKEEGNKATEVATADAKRDDLKLEASNYYGSSGGLSGHHGGLGGQYGGLGGQYGGLSGHHGGVAGHYGGYGFGGGLGSHGFGGLSGHHGGVAVHNTNSYGGSYHGYPVATSYTFQTYPAPSYAHQSYGHTSHGAAGYGYTPAYSSHGHGTAAAHHGAGNAYHSSHVPVHSSYGSSYQPNKGYGESYSSHVRPVYPSYGTGYKGVGGHLGLGSGLTSHAYGGASYASVHASPVVASYGGYHGTYDDKY